MQSKIYVFKIKGEIMEIKIGNESKLYTLKCLIIGTPNTTTFPFVPNGKLRLLSVPIFEHIILRL